MPGSLVRRVALVAAPLIAGTALGWASTGGGWLSASSGMALPFLATPVPTATLTSTATPTPSETPTPAVTNTPTATPTSTLTSTPQPTATPTVTPTPERRGSVLEEGTMLAIYGRGFKIAPILGLLGQYDGFDAMQRDIDKRFVSPIKANNGGRPVVPTIHLIYAMAIPCSPDDDCLLYLEAMGVDIVKDYIEPAGKRGWEVILDSQLGRSNPHAQIKRMIDRGYLNYEHVHVAVDPEFHAYPGRNLPGIPVGQVEAAEINRAQELLDEYVRKQGLKRRKMFMVHQFGDPEVNDGVPFMIKEKKTLKSFPTLDLVLDADGFGGPDAKASKYNLMLNDEVYPFIRFRALKLFTPNPEAPNHYDRPQMTWPAVFGRENTPGGHKVRWAPNVIVIA